MPGEELSSVEESIRELIRQELGKPDLPLPSDARLIDLGISSIKILRIVAKLEKRYDVELADDVIFKAETLRDLALLIVQGGA
jgi:acyl carrier protein